MKFKFKKNKCLWCVIIFQGLFITLLLTIINTQNSPIELRSQVNDLKERVVACELKNTGPVSAEFEVKGKEFQELKKFISDFHNEYKSNLKIMDQNFKLKDQVDNSYGEQLNNINSRLAWDMEFYKALLGHFKIGYKGINE